MERFYSKPIGVIWSGVAGIVAFTFGALVVSLFGNTIEDGFLLFAVSGGIGGLLLSIMTGLWKKIPVVTLVCFIGLHIGVLVSFGIAGSSTWFLSFPNPSAHPGCLTHLRLPS